MSRSKRRGGARPPEGTPLAPPTRHTSPRKLWLGAVALAAAIGAVVLLGRRGPDPGRPLWGSLSPAPAATAWPAVPTPTTIAGRRPPPWDRASRRSGGETARRSPSAAGWKATRPGGLGLRSSPGSPSTILTSRIS